MLANLPITRSPGARLLFLATALLTVLIVNWSNTLSGAGLAPVFFYLFVRLDTVAAGCAVLILVAAAFVPQRYSFDPLLRWIGCNPQSLAGATALLLCAGTLLVYRNYPLSMDEYCAYFQSRVFASGHLTGQFPPALMDWLVPDGFQNYFLYVSHASGRIASSYWPAFALILTPFTWLGVPWACNPMLSALTLIAVHRLAMRIFADTGAAGLAVLLTVASPVFFANGISYYSMPAHLLANTAYALLLIDATPRRAVVAGVIGSLALTLHNPVPHILFALPWILASSWRPGGLRTLGCLFAGYLPLCLVLGFGWAFFSSGLAHEGAAITGPTAAASQNLARVQSAFALPTATLLLARLIGVAKIWVWSVPGLVVLAAMGAWKWRRSIQVRLFLVSGGLTLLGYLFVPVDQGHGWGFRYFHSAWMVLPLLAAGALKTQTDAEPAIAEHDRGSGATILTDGATRTFVVACALLTLVVGNGLRAIQIRTFITENKQQVPAYAGTERRVVIIDPRVSYYGVDLIRNDPWLRGDVIRMITHGIPDDTAMMHSYFPRLQQVYADRFGTVWSASPARAH